MTKVVTFYSYKGGVGRTMALVNVAHVLARDGWRVLLVDFDLEAPGMTHFFADLVRKRPASVKHDALDLLLHAKSTIGWDPAEKKSKPLDIPKSLAEYVVNIPLPDEWKDKVIPYRTGRLDLLPATLEPLEPEEAPEAEPSRDFLRRMDELDLPGIFDERGPRHHFGNHVRKYFVNARFKATGDILFTLRDKVWAAYDIVLVDSRTGLNEVAGLCIGPVCDALVICCGLNDQSIYGTKYFMKKAGLFDRDKAKPYTLVAGPVPPWHTAQAKQRVDDLGQQLGAGRSGKIIEVPYHPAAALRETVFVREEPSEPISHAYRELGDAVAGIAFRYDEAGHGTGAWAPELLMKAIARGQDESRAVSGQIARWLRLWELPQLRPDVRLTGFFASFPSACAVPSLPGREAKDLSRDALPIAAAVAAERLKSDGPFRRARKLLALPVNDNARRHLLIRLLFMQVQTLGMVPDRDPALPDLCAVLHSVGEGTLGARQGELSPTAQMDALVTALAVAGRGGADLLGLADQVVPRAAKGLEEMHSLLRDYFAQVAREGHLRGFSPFAQMSADELFDFWSSHLLGTSVPPITAEGVTCLNHAVSRLTLRPEQREALKQDGMRAVSAWFDWNRFTRTAEDLPTPLGFWPELLMAAANALLKGPDGIEDTLAWLRLGRSCYGYAWRVLVDWRHLESVKDHPAFVEFIRQEDELVNEIESAIDQGEYTL